MHTVTRSGEQAVALGSAVPMPACEERWGVGPDTTCEDVAQVARACRHEAAGGMLLSEASWAVMVAAAACRSVPRRERLATLLSKLPNSTLLRLVHIGPEVLESALVGESRDPEAREALLMLLGRCWALLHGSAAPTPPCLPAMVVDIGQHALAYCVLAEHYRRECPTERDQPAFPTDPWDGEDVSATVVEWWECRLARFCARLAASVGEETAVALLDGLEVLSDPEREQDQPLGQAPLQSRWCWAA